MQNDEVLRKLQLAELDILLAIKDFCAEAGIEWMAYGGTTLGAARHQGFIPWDDDVDIVLLRPDYERFCELAPEGLPAGYTLHTYDDTPAMAGFFAKVEKDGTRFETAETREAGCEQGIYVDVFCLDRLAADPSARARQVRGAIRAQRTSYLYHSGTIQVPHRGVLGAAERLACRVAHPLVRLAYGPDGRAALKRAYYRSVLAGGDAGLTDDYIDFSWAYIDPFPKNMLVPVAELPFEGHMIPVPADWDRYLTITYGDWHKIPAPEERHTHLPLLLDFGDGCVWEEGE